MAIDTRHKRFNMLSFASPIHGWSPHFEADGTVDADDRAHLLHLFGGNALNNPSPNPYPGWGRFVQNAVRSRTR